MSAFQKTIKYLAMAFAVFLTVSIISGILGVLGFFGGFIDGNFSSFRGGDAVNKDVKTYTVSADISSLEIKINAANFVIKQGKNFSVESNLKYLTVEDKVGVLTVKETKEFNSIYSGAKLTLYIPANTNFDKVVINTGAGRVNVDYLSADTVELELGAGEVKINTLIAHNNAYINGGAGQVSVLGGALNNLDLDMGIGQLNLTSEITGNSKFDLGIGESNIDIIGRKDDYRFNLEKGIGDIRLDGEKISEVRGLGQGENVIDVSGGIGTINLKFKGMVAA